MGTYGLALVKLDVKELIDHLNKALADEWMAYYQYWVGAKVAKGPMKGEVIAELLQHATDELRHADMLAVRIIQLGGTPVLDPSEWKKLGTCGYSAPTDPAVRVLLDQNISGEQCAIDVYSKLAEMTKDKDEVTYQIILQILTDEVEHEEDLQALAEDMEMMK
ncbi:ferritin [Patescibacteria group bacterium]|nr:ferritin [Patescibacteria group bacterium]